MQKIADQAAEAAATKAEAEIKDELKAAQDQATTLRLRFEAPAAVGAEAAARARKPYDAAAGRAMGIRALYSGKAQELNSAAEASQEQAKKFAAQALASQQAGGSNAGALYSQAQKLLDQASAQKADAEKFQVVAKGVSETLPAYEQYAGAAALRAMTLANPGQQVVPVMP